MSSVSATFAELNPSGVVGYDFTGVIRAEPGSTIEAAALEGKIASSQIEDEAISTPLLAANAITAAKIGAEEIVAAAIKAGTITTDKIAAGTIDASRIEAHTLTAEQIAAGTITATEIKAGTITGDRIAAATITGDRLVGETITGTQIEAGAITSSKISVATLSALSANAGTLTAGTLIGTTIATAAAGTLPRLVLDSAGLHGYDAEGAEKLRFETTTGIAYVTGVLSSEDGSEIAAKHLSGQITETQIEEGAISTPLLSADSVTSAKILAGAVTASKLSVESLSAITANLGSITAGTITGGTLRTSLLEEAVFDSKGLRFSEGATELHQINWLSGGSSLAHIYGQTSVGTELIVQAQGITGYTTAKAALWANGKNGTHVAGLVVEAEAEEGSRSVVAEAGSAPAYATIIDDQARSGFLQLHATARRLAITGRVNGAGAIEVGEGFTVVKTATGRYAISFSSALASNAIVVATPAETAFRTHFLTGPGTTTSFEIQWVNNALEAADTQFNFIAIG